VQEQIHREPNCCDLEASRGAAVKDVCRDLSISEATYHAWESKYGGMEASDLHRLPDLEAAFGIGFSTGVEIVGH
jgi:hypothetical protein